MGGFCEFGAGWFCSMLEMVFEGCTAATLIYFCAILFHVLYVLVSVGWRSHTLQVTAIFCLWLFKANSLRQFFFNFSFMSCFVKFLMF